jgi:cell division protein FtsA
MVAIDLGSHNVAVGVGTRDDDGKLALVDVAVKPVDGVVRGEIRNIEQVAKAIREALDELETRLGIKITEAYTGISGQHIRCARNSYYVFVGGDGEIREKEVQMLRDNMRNVQAPDGQRILDFIPLNYVIDSDEEVADPVGMYGKKLEATFNFIIGEASAISRLEKALGKVDVRLAGLHINPLVAAEAVVLPDEKELGVAVLDMGAGTTDICIYHDRIPRHIGVVPLGSDMINKDIRSFGILERYIEELKVKYGSAVPENASADRLIKVPGRTPREPKEISFFNLATIISSRLRDILDYAMEEIRRAGYEGRLGAGLVLTGGAAQMKDIDKMVRDYTGMDVRIASPDVQLAEESRAMGADTGFSTLVGLLLKGMQSGKPGMAAAGAPRPIADPASAFTGRTGVFPGAKAAPAPAPEAPRRQAAPEQPVTPPPAPKFEEDFADEGDEKPRKKKRNPISKIFDSITKQFDVIDDNEI